MRLSVLILLAAALPLLWGWAMHWVIEHFWPPSDAASVADDEYQSLNPRRVDYQI